MYLALAWRRAPGARSVFTLHCGAVRQDLTPGELTQLEAQIALCRRLQKAAGPQSLGDEAGFVVRPNTPSEEVTRA